MLPKINESIKNDHIDQLTQQIYGKIKEIWKINNDGILGRIFPNADDMKETPDKERIKEVVEKHFNDLYESEYERCIKTNKENEINAMFNENPRIFNVEYPEIEDIKNKIKEDFVENYQQTGKLEILNKNLNENTRNRNKYGI